MTHYSNRPTLITTIALLDNAQRLADSLASPCGIPAGEPATDGGLRTHLDYELVSLFASGVQDEVNGVCASVRPASSYESGSYAWPC